MTCRGGETRRKGSQTPQRQEMRKIGELHLEDPPHPAWIPWQDLGRFQLTALASPKDLSRERPSMGTCDGLLSEWVTALQARGGDEELVYGQTRRREREKAAAVPSMEVRKR